MARGSVGTDLDAAGDLQDNPSRPAEPGKSLSANRGSSLFLSDKGKTMTENHGKKQSPVVAFLFGNSMFLIAGALGALIWANVNPDSYRHFIHFDLGRMVRGEGQLSHGDAGHGEAGEDPAAAGHEETTAVKAAEGGHDSKESGGHPLTIHVFVNDILMALFFAIAAKEVWESFLPNGALSNPRKAMTPLLATLGGVVGPALLYLIGAIIVGQSGWFGQEGHLGRGWAIPCATDIAFSYLVARLIFGVGHPAIAFLLLLAIADDAAGLVILAVAYPQQPIEPIWFLLTAAAMATAYVLQRCRVMNFWAYLLVPGVMSWFSFYFAGIHAALGLVPIIPLMPHAYTDLGIFARNELQRHDTLNAFEHWWKNPVEIILGLFGLTNAGVVLGNTGTATVLVLMGLVIGKPLGITLFTWMSQRFFKLEIPSGMNYRHIVTLGTVAGIGFTVALFMSEAAYPASAYPEALRDAVKMGALASFLAGAVAFVVAKLVGIKPWTAEETAASAAAGSGESDSNPGEAAVSVAAAPAE